METVLAAAPATVGTIRATGIAAAVKNNFLFKFTYLLYHLLNYIGYIFNNSLHFIE